MIVSLKTEIVVIKILALPMFNIVSDNVTNADADAGASASASTSASTSASARTNADKGADPSAGAEIGKSKKLLRQKDAQIENIKKTPDLKETNEKLEKELKKYRLKLKTF